MRLDLIRVGQGAKGTFGVLRYGEVPFAVTLELPWLDNAQQRSCIPVGTYRCRRIHSPKFGDVFEVMDVPGRSNILFHRGNRLIDTEGCILVGEEFASALDVPIVAGSQRGYTEFMLLLYGRTEFEVCMVQAVVPPLTSAEV